jgi:Sulfotransferase domain
MVKPNLFIAGAPKCGTSSLYDYLRQHPQVFMSPRKEPQFFGSDLQRRQLNSYKFLRNETEYLQLFDKVTNETVIGEASTTYFFSTKAAEDIKAFNPAARIIIMLRNPVEMIYSLYYQLLTQLVEDKPTFEEALAAEERRKQGLDIPKLAYMPDALAYRNIGHLTQHVRRYLDVFARDKVHIIIFDDFKADTARAVRETFDFLSIDPDYPVDVEIANPNSVTRSMALARILSNPPEAVLKIGRPLLPVARPIYRTLGRFNNRATSRPPMKAALRATLRAEFKPDIEQLSQLLGRDLTHWAEN